VQCRVTLSLKNTHTQLKVNERLKNKTWNYKILRWKQTGTLHNFGLHKSKPQVSKAKPDKNQLLCQNNILLQNKWNSQQSGEATTQSENILRNHTSDEGLVSKIRKECLQLKSKRNTLKWANDLNRHVSKNIHRS
jgi:hypothetical protein